MNSQTVSLMGYLKDAEITTDADGNKELLLSYGHDESMTYSMRLSIPVFPDLLATVEGLGQKIELGEVSAVDVTLVEDNPANIGNTNYSRWNKEKAAKTTIATPLGSFCFTLRPHHKSELAELLKPTRQREKGFKSWLRRQLN